jgi:hypothetical protein
MPTLAPRPLRKLAARAPLAIDPARGVAIKRTEHELVIDTDAATFARALRDVLREPDAAFGLIDVKRAPDRAGHDFVVGERFTGCVRLARTAARWRRQRRHALLAPLASALARTRVGAALEDAFLSDFAEIVALEFEPPPGAPYRVVYRYLDGSPMAGASTFLVEPLGPARCCFRARFEWQERGGAAITALHRFGIAMHDEVTALQAARAAERVGARIVSSTIPAAYADA